MILWDFQIKDYGYKKMAEDVIKLQNINKETHDKCVISISDRAHMSENSKSRPYSPQVVAYKIR